jgi:hypothetical protein
MFLKYKLIMLVNKTSIHELFCVMCCLTEIRNTLDLCIVAFIGYIRVEMLFTETLLMLTGLLQVTVKKLVKESPEDFRVSESVENLFCGRDFSVPTVRRSKLVVVDLAGSERIDKSGLWKSCILFHINSNACKSFISEIGLVFRSWGFFSR